MQHRNTPPNRRTVLQTLGAAAVAGGLGLGTASAQEEFEPLGQVSISGDVAEAVPSEDGETAVVAIDSGFVTVDISDPSSPQELARRTDTGLSGVLDVKEEGDRVAVVGPGNRTGRVNGMGLYDVSDPANPEQLAFYDTDYSIHNGFLTDDIAYLIDNESAAVEMIDISDDDPNRVGRYALSGASILHDLWIQDGVAYLNYWNDGTMMLDVSDPANPTEIGKVRDGSSRGGNNDHYVTLNEEGTIIAIGKELLGNRNLGVELWDISDKQNTEFLAEIEPPDQPSDGERTSHNLDIQGDYIYTSWYDGGVYVHDISDPSNPEEVASWRGDASIWTAEVAVPGETVIASDTALLGGGGGLYTFPDPAESSNEPPVARFDVDPSEPVAGESFTLDASASSDPDGQISSYEWSLDGEQVATGPVNDLTLDEAGDYQAKLVVTDDDGATDTTTATLTVQPAPNDPPFARFDVTPSDPAAGEPVTLDASASSDPDGDISSYEWFVDGDLAETGAVNEVTFDEAGQYEIELVVTDDDGATGSETTTLAVGEEPNDPPFARFDVDPAEPVAGESFTLDASASSDPDGEITSYEWSLDGEQVATGPVNDLTLDEPGDYEVELVVSDDDGATGTETKTLTVVPEDNEPPTAEFSVDPAEPVAGESFTLDASASSDPDGEIASYEWSLDGEQVATGPVNDLTIDEAGEYEVELVVTDDDGATDSEGGVLEVVDGGGNCGDESETASASGSISWFDDGDTYTYATRTTNPCSVELALEGSTYFGNLDLYVTYDGRTPTPQDYDDRSAGRGNEELIEASLDGSTEIGILIEGSDAWGQYTITATESGR